MNDNCATHYSPLEYKLGLKIFEETKPGLKKHIEDRLEFHYKNKDRVNTKEFLRILETNRTYIGDTLFQMYFNIYDSLFQKESIEQYDLFR